jgi:hypothetical protein
LRPDRYLGRERAVLLNDMHRGSSWRPPRRTAFAGRLGLLLCLLVLAFGVSAGPAAAYSCGATSPSRTLAGQVSGHRGGRSLRFALPQKKDCDQAPSRTTRRGNADPMSFVFFMGILVAFVAVPLALSRREELSRE